MHLLPSQYLTRTPFSSNPLVGGIFEVRGVQTMSKLKSWSAGMCVILLWWIMPLPMVFAVMFSLGHWDRATVWGPNPGCGMPDYDDMIVSSNCLTQIIVFMSSLRRSWKFDQELIYNFALIVVKTKNNGHTEYWKSLRQQFCIWHDVTMVERNKKPQSQGASKVHRRQICK